MIRYLLFDNAILIVQYAVSGLIPLLLIPHLIKTIGLSSYGDIAIGLSWASYAAVIVQYAFQLTGPKYLAQISTEDSKKTVLQHVFTAKLLLFFLVLISSALIFLSMHTTKLSFPIILLYVLLPLGSVFDACWYLQSAGRFIAASLVSTISAVVSLSIGFGLVAMPADKLTATLSLTIGSILSGLGTFVVSLRMVRSALGRITWQEPLQYLREGWLIFFSQLASSLYMFSGPIIIGKLIDSQAAGAYSAVERIVISITNACLLTHTAAYPRLARLYHGDRDAYRRLMTIVLCIYLAGALFLCAVLALAGESIVRFVFGTESQSNNILMWWGMVLVFLGIFGPMVTGYLVVSGQQDKVYPLTIKVLVISLGLGVPGVLHFGTWAWFCSLAIAQGLVLWTGLQSLRK